MAEQRGIPAFDLKPSKPLVAPWAPLLRQFGPSAASEIAARRAAQERPERVARETAAAKGEWRQYADRYYANPVARAAFDVHQPTEGYDRVICETCMESDCGEVTDATWPCITYARMKAAADA